MKGFLLLLILAVPCWAGTLRLEFAQEGEPAQARAIILIHNAFENRTAFKTVLTCWGQNSWARDQFASVYTYEYHGNDIRGLIAYDTLAKDLYARMRSDDFDIGKADETNPSRRTFPTDSRQPRPSLKKDTLHLLLAGTGYGGLVARQVAVMAKADGVKVTRVAYLGAPLDGMSTVDLVLSFGTAERAKVMGLSQPLDQAGLESMSAAWWGLVALFDEYRDQKSIYAPVYAVSKNFAAYGASQLTGLATDNVLYGRNRRIANDGKGTDGFVPQPQAWGKANGPVIWSNETTLNKVGHPDLSESSFDFLKKQLLDTELTYAYLARRQSVEEYFRGPDPDAKPSGMYYDERDSNGYVPQYRPSYALQGELYKYMWGISP